MLHCDSAAFAHPDELFAALCMILMESRVGREGLDHILGAVGDPKSGIAGRQVANMRHNSHCARLDADVRP
jgi:hypothetical protein